MKDPAVVNPLTVSEKGMKKAIDFRFAACQPLPLERSGKIRGLENPSQLSAPGVFHVQI